MCPSCGYNLKADELVIVDDFRIDPNEWTTYFKDKPFHLSPQEFIILQTLTKEPGKLVKHDPLFLRLDTDADDKILSIVICRLRKNLEKVDPHHSYIQLVWGLGYRWEKLPINQGE